jgi:hypothetical protein
LNNRHRCAVNRKDVYRFRYADDASMSFARHAGMLVAGASEVRITADISVVPCTDFDSISIRCVLDCLTD